MNKITINEVIWDTVIAQVMSQLLTSTKFGDQVKNQVWDQVKNQVWNNVRKHVQNQAWNQIRQHVNKVGEHDKQDF